MTPEAREQDRHRWLAALGIDSWLPRGTLPGAAAPAAWVADFRYPAGDENDDWQADAESDCEQPEGPAATPSSPAAAPEARRAPTGRPGIDTNSLLTPREQPATERMQGAPAPHSALAAATAEVPRFKLAFLLRQDLLIIDSLPPHQRQGFSREHRALLTGITSALGARSDAELSDASLVRWPMLTSRTLNQSVAEAQVAVRRKLERTLKLHAGIRRILLMGDAAARWVLEDSSPLEELQGRSLALRADIPAVVTLSLTELLRLPERKVETWRDIQPLRDVHG